MITLCIGESRPKKWMPLAKLIMWIEGTDHSHSFISYKDNRYPDVRYVAEARGSGCRILSNHQFKNDNYVVRVFEYEVNQETLDEIHKDIYTQLAKPYAHKQLIGMGYIRLLKLFGRQVSNPFKDGDFSQVCVELSARALFKAIKSSLPSDIEDYGLKEMHKLNLLYGKLVEQEKIDRINGVKKTK